MFFHLFPTWWEHLIGIHQIFAQKSCRKVFEVPALYKIFDEILVNAADNLQRDPQDTVSIQSFVVKFHEISIWLLVKTLAPSEPQNSW